MLKGGAPVRQAALKTADRMNLVTRIGPIFAVIALVALLATTSASASAQASAARLGIRPLDVEGTYFSVTMSPGETRQLTVELGNFGDTTVDAKTFAADAYTLVNGGFGARLAGEASSGVTSWVAYPADTLTIEPGQAVVRTFDLTVPDDAPPGEYITSLVIQNATPTATGGSGSIAMNQITRQAIAVAITVPGPLVPGLQLGTATYKPVGTRAVLSFAVTNSGTMHLKPAGEFVLATPDGTEVSRGPVAMETFYAGTETRVEALLAQPVNPGDYVVSLNLADAKSGATASVASLPLTVPTAAVASGAAGSAPSGAAVNQPAAAERASAGTPEAGDPWSLPLVLLGLGGVLVVLLLSILLGRARRSGQRAPTGSVTRTARSAARGTPSGRPTGPGLPPLRALSRRSDKG